MYIFTSDRRYVDALDKGSVFGYLLIVTIVVLKEFYSPLGECQCVVALAPETCG